ncbi:MAG: hypothetical protein ABL308_04345 [Oceanicaulis sp.]
MRLYTMTPIRTGYRLAAGVTPATEQYAGLMKRLAALPSEDVTLVNKDAERSGRWKDIAVDGFDLRVAIFEPGHKAGEPEVRFHIYGSGVAIAEVRFDDVDAANGDLEGWSQTESHKAYKGHVSAFCALLERMGRLTGDLLEGNPARCGEVEHGHTSRALVISEAERADPATAPLVQDWLKNTIRPEDAGDILAGEAHYSLTWLNYLIVEPDGEEGPKETQFLLSAMRIAQYFWSAQDWANESTRQIVADALTARRPRRAEQSLLRARSRMQMLQIEYESLRAVLNRRKEKLVSEILDTWSIDALKANGAQLVELSSGKIKEISAARTRRSEFVTGLILFGIGAVAVLEAIFAAISFSREVMLRPALGYTDEQGSLLLRIIAAADSDFLLGSGLILILLLTVIYVRYQRK